MRKNIPLGNPGVTLFAMENPKIVLLVYKAKNEASYLLEYFETLLPLHLEA
jgi:hypothetical protein